MQEAMYTHMCIHIIPIDTYVCTLYDSSLLIHKYDVDIYYYFQLQRYVVNNSTTQ